MYTDLSRFCPARHCCRPLPSGIAQTLEPHDNDYRHSILTTPRPDSLARHAMLMYSKLHQVLNAAVLRILRPLVRILLQHGIPFGVFADIAKRVYVEVADSEFPIPGRKQTKSRVSVLTGLSRKEVLRVKRLPSLDDANAAARYHRAARTISGWLRDKDFTDRKGQPAVLPLDSGKSSFTELVKRYSGDIPARAVLDEMERVGASRAT